VRSDPRVLVCAGGGGVGKTTAAAALALGLARRGGVTLVVTVDPARRLAQAMGVEVDAEVHLAHIEGTEKRLYALMPEPRVSTRTFVEVLFHDEPEALERMLENRVYRTLGDALAGIHELVSLMLVARAVEEGAYDYLVVDTAPSRYALDFVSYPGRLAQLLEGRAVGWFGGLAQRAASQAGEPGPPEDERGLVAWGKKRVESALTRILDPRTIRDLAGLFGELSLVRGRFADLARASERLLLGPDARYVLVAAPSGSAEADARYIAGKLDRLKQKPSALLLNRADEATPEWIRALRSAEGGTLPVSRALDRIEEELAARRRAGDTVERSLGRAMPGARTLRLPTVEARDPSHVVRALADCLEPRLDELRLA